MALTCAAACVVCNLDGFTNSSSIGQQGQAPPGYCTQFVHTMGWVGFVAGSTDLTISVEVGDCTSGNSIEMGIYSTPDCQNFELVSDCNTAMFQLNTYTFTNTVSLTPGCTYYLVFDNNGPAVCPYTVSVLSGSASAPPLTPAAQPMGPDTVCPGSTVTYTIPEVFGACEYIWTAPPGSTINGMSGPVSAGSSVDITFGNSSGSVCVRPDNACYDVGPTCLPVTVAPIPPTILPPVTVCFGENYLWIDGNFYTGNQMMSATLTSYLGCDSIVRQQLITAPPINTNLGVQTICEGECVMVGNQNFCAPGGYSVMLTAENGCDSTVIFTVNVLQVDALASVSDSITCLQPVVTLSSNGSSPGAYAWYNPAQQLIGTGTTQSVSAPGIYKLIVTRSGGGITCADSALVNVVLNAQLPPVSATGDTIGCDGLPVQLTGSSPAPNLAYTWSGPGINPGNQNQQNPAVDSAGVYILSVQDTLTGCSNQDTAEVLSLGLPPLLTLMADTLTCADTAEISATSNLPGTTFAWAGPGGFSDTLPVVSVAVPGVYVLNGTSPTGCVTADSIEVIGDLAPPVFTLGADTLTCKDTLVWLFAANVSQNTYTWSGPAAFSAAGDSVQASTPGMYVVTATGSNACTRTDSLLMPTNFAVPQVSAAGDTLDCNLSQATLTGASITPGAVFNWSGPGGFSDTLPVTTTSNAGLYTLTVTGPNGCTATATSEVFLDDDLPNLNASADTLLNCAIQSVELFAQTDSTGATLSWSGPGGYSIQNDTAVADLPGLYLVTATAPNGCSVSDSVFVFIDVAPPDAAALGDTLDCAANGVFLQGSTLTPGAQLLWNGPGAFSDSTANPFVFVIGTYTLTVTGPNGCTATATAEVVPDVDAPSVSIAAPVVITCTQPQSVLSANTGTAGLTYGWTGPGGFVSTDSSFSTSLPGVYNLVVTAPNGCTVSAAETIPVDTLAPDVQAVGDTLSCAQPNGMLSGSSATNGAAASWAGPGGFTAQGFDAICSDTGMYFITVVAPNGCSASTGVSMAGDFGIPDAFPTVLNEITCNDTFSTLDIFSNTPGVTVQWLGPGGFQQQGLNVQVTQAGAYIAATTAPNGCSRVDTLQVLQNTTPPDVQLDADTLTCTNPSVAVQAQSGSPGALFNWTGPGGFSSADPAPSVQLPGTYVLTATAPNGCTTTDSIVVPSNQVAPVLQIPALQPLTCLLTAVDVTAGTDIPQTQLLWLGPGGWTSSGNPATLSLAGNYLLVGTAPNGCMDTLQFELPIDTAPPQVMANAGQITCAQPLADLIGQSGTPGVSFQWQGPNGFADQNPQTQTGFPGIYSLEVTGPNGCSAAQTVNVTADTLPPIVTAVVGNVLTCLDSTAVISAQTSPSGAQLSWTGPGGQNGSGPSIAVTVPGLYLVEALLPNGCTGADTVSVFENVQIPDVQAAGDTLDCSGNGVALSAGSATQGVQFAWSGPGGFSAAIPNPLVPLPGNYTLVLSAPNGCTNTAQVTVFPPSNVPPVDAVGDTITCANNLVTLSVLQSNPDLTYTWIGPDGFSADGNQIETSLPGSYTVYAETSDGCVDSALVFVPTDTTAPVLMLADAFIPCAGTDAMLSLVSDPSDVLLSWNGPQPGLPAAPEITVSIPGLYTVQATATNGCSAEAQALVEAQTPGWWLELGPDRIVGEGEIVGIGQVTDLPFTDRQSQEWIPNVGCGPCIPQVFLADTSFWLQLTIVDLNGCRLSDSLYIEVVPNPMIYAPNVFSPESNDSNNGFQLFAGKGVARIRSLRIFDRWGGQVFGAADYLPGDASGIWDGRQGADELNPAVFIWVAEVEGLQGDVVMFKGDVTVVR